MSKNIYKAYKRDVGGNVAMMFAFSVFVFIGGLALAVDGSRAYNTRSALTDIADAASLAGAYSASTDKDNRDEVVRKTLAAHAANLPENQTLGEPIIVFNDGTEELTVTLSSVVESTFGRVLGKENLVISAQSVTSYAIQEVQPVSLALVVDISGSMGWAAADGQIKIDSLKDATNKLFDAIEESAPRRDVLLTKVRSGLTAYNTDILPEYTKPMAYGWDHVRSEVMSMYADGGTSSTNAFQAGYNMLANDSNKPENLRQFIVFMTDGANNDVADNALTEAFCAQAKNQGIKIYSVAFEAPQEGRDMLLTCASNNDDSEEQVECKAKGVLNGSASSNGVANTNDETKKKNCEVKKSAYYFDADNAAEFEAAFKQIGNEIGNLTTRVVR